MDDRLIDVKVTRSIIGVLKSLNEIIKSQKSKSLELSGLGSISVKGNTMTIVIKDGDKSVEEIFDDLHS